MHGIMGSHCNECRERDNMLLCLVDLDGYGFDIIIQGCSVVCELVIVQKFVIWVLLMAQGLLRDSLGTELVGMSWY